MERLWIANIAPGTTDDEIKALVAKYSRDPIECAEIQHVEGDGSRPAVLMTITGKKFDTLGNLGLRLNGMFWKGRTLSASTMLGCSRCGRSPIFRRAGENRSGAPRSARR